MRDFCAFNKLKITNSFYRHKDTDTFTWEARGIKSVLNYIIINDRLQSNIGDTRDFRGSETDSDHKLVERKFKFLTHAKHSYNKTDKTIYICSSLKLAVGMFGESEQLTAVTCNY